MGLYNYAINKSDSSNLSFFDKSTLMNIDYENTSKRPADGYLTKSKDSETAINESYSVIRYHHLFNLSKMSDTLQIIFNTRSRKTFRSGFDIRPEYENAVESGKEYCMEWIKECNQNKQSLKEVFIELDHDLNWADDAYLLCLKDYAYNNQGIIIGSNVKEFVRVHPLLVQLILDKNNKLGFMQEEENGYSQKAYVSPFNRSVLTTNEYDEQGRKNIQAHYEVKSAGGSMYYNSNEIMHKSAYNPSLTYGYSPLFSLYQKILILMLQDSYMKKYYGDDKPTKGLIVFNTSNKEALMKTFDEIRQKTQQNPHSIKPIVAESSDGRKPVEYIDMAKTLNEMQFTASREELRQQIGAMYGVSPMFQNDMSTGGGLNNEGLQITVTNEVIEDRQNLFNESFIDFVFRQNLGITDWCVTIKPDIEQDLMAEEQLSSQRIANARAKLELGIEGYYDKNGEFIFYESDLKKPEVEQPTDMSMFGLSDKQDNIQVGIPINKAKKKTISEEQTKLNSKLDEELKSILSQLDLKKKPKQESIINSVTQISDKLRERLRKLASNVFNGIYERFAKDTSKQLNTKFEMTEEDKEVLSRLKKDPAYYESFSNMAQELSDVINVRINQAYGQEDFSLDKLVEQIEEETNIAKNRVRTIVRTETVKLSVAAQKTQLDKTGAEYEFRHIGVIDKRTGEDTKALIGLTKDWVSWEDYIRLARQVVSKYNPKWVINVNAPILHPNQRSRVTFRRKKE